MNMDIQAINRHIFTDGKIQLSPAEIQQLNSQPPVPFQASYIDKRSDAGYKVLLSGYAYKVLSTVDPRFKQDLERTLNKLRAAPRTAEGFVKKGSVDTLMTESIYHNIWYKVHSGQVFVYNIELKDIVQRALDKLEKIGIYKIKKNPSGHWEMKAKVDSVKTEYAAVNGQSNNLTKATWLMGAHLDFEFGKGVINEYTLYHNPSVSGIGDTWESAQDRYGFTTEVTQKFSHLLQKTQQEENKTKWVAHSQGGLIFSEAVRYHLNGNSSWAITGGFNGVLRKDKGQSLDMHSVAMHGNANNNARSKLLFDRAGVEVIATRANEYDFVNVFPLFGGTNSVNPWRMLGSLAYLNHVFTGSPQQSPHTLMHDDLNAWDNQMKNGPGKGRSSLQKGFDTIDKAGRSGVKYIRNYLK